jgi:hypothetical protein
MNDTILIQQVYPKLGYLPLLTENFTRNAKYCEEHDIDYVVFFSETLDPIHGGWDKVLHVRDALKKYKLVIWLDVDACIYDLTRDMKTVPNPPDTIGAVRFMLPTSHLNVGVLYFRNGEKVVQFVDEWLAAFPGPGAWHEQAVFNQMTPANRRPNQSSFAGVKNETVYELPAEWNLNFNYNANSNPVVMGFHGFGTADNRLAMMRKSLEAQTRRMSAEAREN